MTRMNQPGSLPLEIPEQIPNPAYIPKTEPAPQVPVPAEPVRIPERVSHRAPATATALFFFLPHFELKTTRG